MLKKPSGLTEPFFGEHGVEFHPLAHPCHVPDLNEGTSHPLCVGIGGDEELFIGRNGVNGAGFAMLDMKEPLSPQSIDDFKGPTNGYLQPLRDIPVRRPIIMLFPVGFDIRERASLTGGDGFSPIRNIFLPATNDSSISS